jgi:hypothetical protein
MTAPTRLNLKIYQGSTFRQILRWESATKVYAPVTSITNAAPMVITANAHGAPQGWRVKVSNVGGMKEANNLDYVIATGTTTNTVTINSVNSIGFATYTSGGVLEYNQPVDLSGVTARMQIRPKVDSDQILDSLTTENNKIVLDNVLKTITVQIDESVTASYSFKSAVYDLEIVKNNDVIPFLTGTVLLTKEVTR